MMDISISSMEFQAPHVSINLQLVYHTIPDTSGDLLSIRIMPIET